MTGLEDGFEMYYCLVANNDAEFYSLLSNGNMFAEVKWSLPVLVYDGGSMLQFRCANDCQSESNPPQLQMHNQIIN